MKVLIVCGTRPEAIKMAPVYMKLIELGFKVFYCNSGQHRDMMKPVNDFFKIKEDFNLNAMNEGQSLSELFSKVVMGVDKIISKIKPDVVLIHGDTTTSTAAALAAFYSGVKVGHVEAGLRTYNTESPFPEELNRQVSARIANFHFCPTQTSKTNLLSEHGNSNSIVEVTGNTIIDALSYAVRILRRDDSLINPILKSLMGTKYILVTFHRRENHDKVSILISSILDILGKTSILQFVIPVHPNPMVQIPLIEAFQYNDRVILLQPLAYPEFIWLMDHSFLILTDSGGVQEEAPSLGKPVLVLREETERPEAIERGTAILVGLNQEKIVCNVMELLQSEEKYKRIQVLENPYGDGKASLRIANILNETRA